MIKVATMNTWNCAGDYKQQLAFQVRSLKKEKIDILCCREAFCTLDGKYNSAGILATKLGMTCSFSAARQERMVFQEKEIESIFGLAILTGAGVWMLHSGSFVLPEKSGENGPMVQFAVIRKDGDAVLVLNLHFSHLQNKGRLRRKQLQAIFAHPIMGKQFAAILFCGDFFENSADEELALLKKQSFYKVRDGFVAGSAGHLLSTLVQKNDATDRQSCRRIDHIFVLEEKKQPVAKLNFANSRLLLDQTESDSILHPDHFGVAFDLKLSRVKKDETSQVYRYVACTQPWSGKKKRECFC